MYNEYFIYILVLFLIVCVFDTGDQIQGLANVRKVLYYRVTAPAFNFLIKEITHIDGFVVRYLNKTHKVTLNLNHHQPSACPLHGNIVRN